MALHRRIQSILLAVGIVASLLADIYQHVSWDLTTLTTTMNAYNSLNVPVDGVVSNRTVSSSRASSSSSRAESSLSPRKQLNNGGRSMFWFEAAPGRHNEQNINNSIISASPECLAKQERIEKMCSSIVGELFVCDNTSKLTAKFSSRQVLEQQQQDMRTTTTTTTTTPPPTRTCKTLWFAGFHEGSQSYCTEKGGGYRLDYARALASARVNAAETLQPVLLLGRYGLTNNKTSSAKADGANNNNNNNSVYNQHDARALRAWARRQGALVIQVDELSFHGSAVRWHGGNNKTIDHLMGPYLRMDIPKIIREHNLFDRLPHVCPQHVLYTDSDILFVSEITHRDMNNLKAQLSVPNDRSDPSARPPFVLYGPENRMNGAKPFNTGVMLMDVHRFEQEMPAMLKFHNDYPPKLADKVIHTFDQSWMNLYFEQPGKEGGRTLLSPYWNWKSYWALPPPPPPPPPPQPEETTMRQRQHVPLSNIKVIHFHGPKPGKTLWRMAFCKTTPNHSEYLAYQIFVMKGICCNGGKTAYNIWEFVKAIAPTAQEVCYL